ncbi:hypothetical protein QR680_006902 [Steinernema hermaphroditum]|uniref:Uncharacterized protein n=1 Tax=Steinernema hermaphroditum TaxID=289476 RepID=A0AA39HZ40_9BILA|nr:hypothetical protein QR680_006902 [Steinernema hermaphroditum]
MLHFRNSRFSRVLRIGSLMAARRELSSWKPPAEPKLQLYNSLSRSKEVFKPLNPDQICDNVRDEELPKLGVRLEDKDGETCIKLVDPKELLREKEQKKQAEAAKLAEKQKLERQRQEAQKAKEAQRRVNPADLFTKGPDAGLYSKFDERGVPTHLTNGEEISKKQFKKLEKLYEQQKKSYEQAMNVRG